jgi:hypothetical protein
MKTKTFFSLMIFLLLPSCTGTTKKAEHSKSKRIYRIEVEVLNQSENMRYGISMKTDAGVAFYDELNKSETKNNEFSTDIKSETAVFTTTRPVSSASVAIVANKGKNPMETIKLTVLAGNEIIFHESIRTLKERNVIKYVE